MLNSMLGKKQKVENLNVVKGMPSKGKFSNFNEYADIFITGKHAPNNLPPYSPVSNSTLLNNSDTLKTLLNAKNLGDKKSTTKTQELLFRFNKRMGGHKQFKKFVETEKSLNAEPIISQNAAKLGPQIKNTGTAYSSNAEKIKDITAKASQNKNISNFINILKNNPKNVGVAGLAALGTVGTAAYLYNRQKTASANTTSTVLTTGKRIAKNTNIINKKKAIKAGNRYANFVLQGPQERVGQENLANLLDGYLPKWY